MLSNVRIDHRAMVCSGNPNTVAVSGKIAISEAHLSESGRAIRQILVHIIDYYRQINRDKVFHEMRAIDAIIHDQISKWHRLSWEVCFRTLINVNGLPDTDANPSSGQGVLGFMVISCRMILYLKNFALTTAESRKAKEWLLDTLKTNKALPTLMDYVIRTEHAEQGSIMTMLMRGFVWVMRSVLTNDDLLDLCKDVTPADCKQSRLISIINYYHQPSR